MSKPDRRVKVGFMCTAHDWCYYRYCDLDDPNWNLTLNNASRDSNRLLEMHKQQINGGCQIKEWTRREAIAARIAYVYRGTSSASSPIKSTNAPCTCSLCKRSNEDPTIVNDDGRGYSTYPGGLKTLTYSWKADLQHNEAIRRAPISAPKGMAPYDD